MRVLEKRLGDVLKRDLYTVLIAMIGDYLNEYEHNVWDWTFRAVRFGERWNLKQFKYMGWEPHICQGSCLCIIDGPWSRGIKYVEPTDARSWDLSGDIGLIFGDDPPIWQESADDYMKRCGLCRFQWSKHEVGRDTFHKRIMVSYTNDNNVLLFIQFSEPTIQVVKLLKN